ncbi:hypothetical protein COO09_12005 [Rhizorhabdus dicambivorans]|uniref:Uncharacterized protein n=1 Tax=Rhizorhabdus dicambivorans TaxID=1850238 RepID=A0A2A4FWF4_9SPHN|nr:hypothetical protein CMV14_18300 [Rhizorhabdus dicambivorans]PCE42039.1 hypothetical protein COO09_12005 [Rhizorhabdus dicambivorans]
MACFYSAPLAWNQTAVDTHEAPALKTVGDQCRHSLIIFDDEKAHGFNVDFPPGTKGKKD